MTTKTEKPKSFAAKTEKRKTENPNAPLSKVWDGLQDTRRAELVYLFTLGKPVQLSFKDMLVCHLSIRIPSTPH